MAGSVVWSETPDDDARTEAESDPEEQTGGEVDESLATRRLRHWLRGMFGGAARPPDEPS